MNRAHRIRQVVNAISGATLLGLVVAKLGRAQLLTAPDGLVIAMHWQTHYPQARAMTIGNIIMIRDNTDVTTLLTHDDALIAHEARHCSQWACCLGLPMLICYPLAALWSQARTGDHWSRNVFERRAVLTDGGYTEHPLRRRRRRRSAN